MQLKTSSLEFERYGSVYDKPVSPGNSGMIIMPTTPSAPPQTPHITGIHLLSRPVALTISPIRYAMTVIAATLAMPTISML